MSQLPLVVSIIVPVFNSASYVGKCIKSILSQTYDKFELLLINDGSTDQSGQICETYSRKDQRIRVFHQENQGVTKARELGVEKSEGEYIMFVDSDDTLQPNAIKTLIENIKLCDIVISDSILGTINKEEYINCLLKNQISWCCWGKLYKKHLFQPSPFGIPRYFNIGEDLMMQLNLSNNIRCNIRCIEDCIYSVTENPNSVTRSRNFSVEYETKFIDEIIRITNKLGVECRASLYELKMGSLYGLIKSGTKVSYKIKWIQRLKRENKKYGKSLRDAILLFVPNNSLCRKLIKIKEFLR